MIKKLTFAELDTANKDVAMHQMLSLSKIYNWPGNTWWNDEESIKEDIAGNYNADEYFTFYEDEFGEVITKIG